jgi:uncharacterized protein (DUF1697 family)
VRSLTVDPASHLGNDRLAQPGNCMTYVALLRAVNVGGKNIIRMAALRECLEQAGFVSVQTLIQSGNVILESSERSVPRVTNVLEDAVSKTMGTSSLIVVLTHARLRSVVMDAPRDWARRSLAAHLRLHCPRSVLS